MAPSQGDYLHGESQLVPGGLTVYRHFQVDQYSRLLSMGEKPYDERQAPVHEAACERKLWSPIRGTGYNLSKPLHPVDPAPRVDCTCGFYAHYDPATDFYPDTGWCLDNVTRNDFYSSHAFLTSSRQVDYVGLHAMVRAVVEVSGTTIMGGRGVRAAKMRVKAMAVDWDKYLSLETVRETEPESIRFFWDDWRMPVLPEIRTRQVERPVLGKPGSHIRESVETVVRATAKRHGAEFYTDPAEMYAAHPKPDLSALGVEERDAPAGIQVNVTGVRQTQQSFQQMKAALQQATYNLQRFQQATYSFPSGDVIDEAIFGAKPKQKRQLPKGGKIENPVVKAALEKKRNRPAPPGTGIDRRKGKLR